MIARLRIDPVSRGAGMTAPRVRERLVERLREQGIRDERVLTAIAAVPRHLFMDEALAARAYEDSALPIASGQTISQPWVVARMTELLLDSPVLPRKVLEIGTGSGYQAAVLAELGLEVHTVERIGRLLRRARTLLRGLGHTVRSRHDDGRAGWPELSPFDAILVSAGADAVEPGLLAQLAAHGTLVAPVGPANDQALVRIRGDGEGGWREERLQPVVFVPLLHGVVDA